MQQQKYKQPFLAATNMNNKGSTLFLAMVIIGVVLASGMGVALLLSRQVGETEIRESSALSYYLAESVAEMMDKEDIEEIDWQDFQRENEGRQIRYKGKKNPENEEEYVVDVQVGGNYFSFEKEKKEEHTIVGEEETEEGFILIYYQTERWNNWEPPYIVKRDPLGNYGSSGTTGMEMEKSNNLRGWHFYKLDLEGHSYFEIAFRDSGYERDWGEYNHFHRAY